MTIEGGNRYSKPDNYVNVGPYLADELIGPFDKEKFVDNLTVVDTYNNFGLGLIPDFNTKIEDTIISNPQEGIVLVNVGRPGCGKTLTLDRLRELMYSRDSRIRSLIEKNGILFSDVQWGHASIPIPDQERVIVPITEYNNTSLKEQKRRELGVAGNIFGEGLREGIVVSKLKRSLKYDPTSAIKVITADIPLPTGYKMGNTTAGFIRGLGQLSDLINKKGIFKEIEQPYSVFIIGMDASPSVRDRAIKNRMVKPPEFTNNRSKDATVEEMQILDAEVIEVIAMLASKIRGCLSKNLTTDQRKDNEHVRQFLQNHKDSLSDIVPQFILPYMISKLGFPSDKSIFLRNDILYEDLDTEEDPIIRVLPEKDVYLPIQALYPNEFTFA